MLRKANPDPQMKSLSESGNGAVRFYLSTWANWDRVRPLPERPRPGAFAASLPAFRKDGFIAYAHGWDRVPIGWPTAATEDDLGLLVDMEYHSTDLAQMVRTTVNERLAAGMSVKTSMGYDLLDSEVVPVTDRALNAEGIEKGRELTEIYLFEGSIVNVPANPAADVTQAKELALLPPRRGALLTAVKDLYTDPAAAEWEAQEVLYTLLSYVRERRLLESADPAALVIVARLLRDATAVVDDLFTADPATQGKARTPVARVPFVLEAAHLATGCRQLVDRAARMERARAKEGRVLSTANRSKLTDFRAAMRELLTIIDDLLDASEPKDAKALHGVLLDFLRLEATLNGVPTQ